VGWLKGRIKEYLRMKDQRNLEHVYFFYELKIKGLGFWRRIKEGV